MIWTREQTTAWCALENLRLCYYGHEVRLRWRVLHIPNTYIGLRWVGLERDWALGPASAPDDDYTTADWTELPDECFNILTPELLQQLADAK